METMYACKPLTYIAGSATHLTAELKTSCNRGFSVAAILERNCPAPDGDSCHTIRSRSQSTRQSRAKNVDAYRSELNGVVDEVREDLPDPSRVAIDDAPE